MNAELRPTGTGPYPKGALCSTHTGETNAGATPSQAGDASLVTSGLDHLASTGRPGGTTDASSRSRHANAYCPTPPVPNAPAGRRRSVHCQEVVEARVDLHMERCADLKRRLRCAKGQQRAVLERQLSLEMRACNEQLARLQEPQKQLDGLEVLLPRPQNTSPSRTDIDAGPTETAWWCKKVHDACSKSRATAAHIAPIGETSSKNLYVAARDWARAALLIRGLAARPVLQADERDKLAQLLKNAGAASALTRRTELDEQAYHPRVRRDLEGLSATAQKLVTNILARIDAQTTPAAKDEAAKQPEQDNAGRTNAWFASIAAQPALAWQKQFEQKQRSWEGLNLQIRSLEEQAETYEGSHWQTENDRREAHATIAALKGRSGLLHPFNARRYHSAARQVAGLGRHGTQEEREGEKYRDLKELVQERRVQLETMQSECVRDRSAVIAGIVDRAVGEGSRASSDLAASAREALQAADDMYARAASMHTGIDDLGRVPLETGYLALLQSPFLTVDELGREAFGWPEKRQAQLRDSTFPLETGYLALLQSPLLTDAERTEIGQELQRVRDLRTHATAACKALRGKALASQPYYQNEYGLAPAKELFATAALSGLEAAGRGAAIAQCIAQRVEATLEAERRPLRDRADKVLRHVEDKVYTKVYGRPPTRQDS